MASRFDFPTFIDLPVPLPELWRPGRGARTARPIDTRFSLNWNSPQSAGLHSGIPIIGKGAQRDIFNREVTPLITPTYTVVPNHGLALTNAVNNGLLVAAGPVGDFGVGDFGVAVWCQTTSNSTQVAMAMYGSPDVWWLGTGYAGAGLPIFALPTHNTSGSVAINDGRPHLLMGLRISGVAYLYVDGVLANSTAAAEAVNTGVRLRIGDGFGSGNFPWNGELWHAWVTTRPSHAMVPAAFDPRTRWDLYQSQPTRSYLFLGETATTGDQAVSLPTLTSGTQLYAPTIAPGAVTVTLPTLTSGAVLYAPTVALVQDLILPFLSSGSSVFAPTVAPGAVTLTLPTLTSGLSMYTPSILGSYDLTLPFLSSGLSLFVPTITTGGTTLTLPFLASTELDYAPTLAYAFSLPTLTSGLQLFAPTLAPGAVTLILPFTSSVEQDFAPTLTVGNDIALPFLSSGLAMYTPTIAAGAVSLTLPFLSSTASLYTPTFTTTYGLSLPFLSSGLSLYTPTIVPGAVALTLPFRASTETLFAPTLVPDQILILPFRASGLSLYAPSLSYMQALSLPFRTTTEQLFAPTIFTINIDPEIVGTTFTFTTQVSARLPVALTVEGVFER